jgi:hypothetical protein
VGKAEGKGRVEDDGEPVLGEEATVDDFVGTYAGYPCSQWNKMQDRW